MQVSQLGAAGGGQKFSVQIPRPSVAALCPHDSRRLWNSRHCVPGWGRPFQEQESRLEAARGQLREAHLSLPKLRSDPHLDAPGWNEWTPEPSLGPAGSLRPGPSGALPQK